MQGGEAEVRRGWVLVGMTAVLSMVLMNETTVSVALPSITKDLGLGINGAGWVINVYILVFASLVAVGGRLGDLYGRHNVLLVGTLIFAIGAMACGFSSSAGQIFAARAVQGCGAALMVPASAAIVTSVFPMGERGRAMAIYAGLAQVFLAAGPLIGGVLVESLGWGWTFFLNLPITVFCWLAVRIGRLPSGVPAAAQLDRLGALLLPVGLFGFVFALQQGAVWGWLALPTLLAGIGGLILLAVFVQVERGREDPLVEMDLLRIRPFRLDALLLFCIQGTIAAITVYGALFLQHVLGLSPLNAGVAMLSVALPVLVATQFAGALFDRFGVRPGASIGLMLASGGGFWIALTLSELSLPLFATGLAVLGTGLGLSLAPVNTDALSRLPGVARGQGSGVLQTLRQAGGAFGVALMTSIVTVSLSDHANASDAQQAHAFSRAFLFAALLAAFGALVAWRLPRGRQVREPTTIEEAIRFGQHQADGGAAQEGEDA